MCRFGTCSLIALFTYGCRAIHHDEDVYPNPDEFKPERYLAADGVTAISFANTKDHGHLTYGLGRRWVVSLPFFSRLSDHIPHIHKVMHWLHCRKVCAATIILHISFPSLLISQSNSFSNSLKLNAASIVFAFNINPAKDAKGRKILPDPNDLLDEGLAV